MRYVSITKSDVANGTGCRVTLWVSGCNRHCRGCHNPETWDFSAGKEFTDLTLRVILDECDHPYISGLTLSGGDPMDSWDDVRKVVEAFKERFGDSKDVWLYTGLSTDDLLDFGYIGELHDAGVDYIVEGPYIQELRNTSLAFRGSENQGILRRTEDSYKDVTEELDGYTVF